MEEKFYGSNMIKIFLNLTVLVIIIVMVKASIDIFNDESLNLVKKIGVVIVYISFLVALVLVVIRGNKYYVFLSESYIEVNGFIRKTIISNKDICEVIRADGINIRYFKGDKKNTIFISSSIKGFKRIRNHVVYSHDFDNKCFNGYEINKIKKTFYKDGIILAIKTLTDTELKKYTKRKPYKVIDVKNLSFINDSSEFISTLVKSTNGEIIEVIFEELSR